MNTLIKNAVIITMDDENPLVNGDIGISGGTISFIGKSNDFTSDKIIDAKGNVVMPGLVNAHTHTPMTLLRSYSDDVNLQKWLFDNIFPIEETFDEDDIYWGSMLACWEMISGGTTSFADMYFLNKPTAEVAVQSGMRANICRALQCFEDKTDFSNDYRMCEAIDLYTNYNGAGNGRITVEMSAHAVYTNTPNYLRFVAETTERLGTGMHTHISETSYENEQCMQKYGKTPTKLFSDCGFFGTRTLAAHCVYLSDNDVDIFKDKKINIVHNPTSNLKLGSGIAPIESYINKGINVALGTDGAASNNNLNMFEEIHLASLLQKGVNKSPTDISAACAIKMATINGAAALGLKKTGILKQGYNADLIIIDTDKPHMMPIYNPLSIIAYSAQSSDVLSVMCGGEFLMENKEHKTLDIEKIKYHIKKKGGKINAARSSENV